MMKPRVRAVVVGVFVLLFLVAGVGFVRAVHKATSERGCEDFALIYTSAKAWRTGVNPYATDSLAEVWAHTHGPAAMGPNNYFELSLYPPCTLVALAPWSYASWPVARDAWALTNVALIVAAMGALLDLTGIAWPDWRVPALLAMVLALGAFRVTVNYGQPAASACASIILAAALARRGRDVPAAVLLAIALAIKAQIAGPFLVYYLCRRRWTLGAVCIGMVGAMTLLAVVRMRAAGVDWVHPWLANLKVVSAPRGINDVAASGHSRFQMVNLQVILTSLMGRAAANALTLLLVGVTTAWVLLTTWLRRVEPDRRTELAELSLMTTLGLLVVYHRWYDTGALAFCLAWAAVAWNGLRLEPTTPADRARGRALAVAAVLLVMPFFASLAFKLRPAGKLIRVSSTEYVPAFQTIHGRWYMDLFVLPNQVWALVLLVGLFLYVREVGRAAVDPLSR